jgi:hypothetical protein
MSSSVVKYPYNLSPLANIRSILGPSPLLWLWPGQRTLGSGTRYKIAEGAGGEWIEFHRSDRSREKSGGGGRVDAASLLARNVEDVVEGVVGSASGRGIERGGRGRRWTAGDDEEAKGEE